MKYHIPKKLFKLLNKKDSYIKFLIVRNGLIGDMVFITPVIERLNRELPGAKIDLAIGHKTKGLFISHPGIQNIYLLPKKFSILKHILFFLFFKKK